MLLLSIIPSNVGLAAEVQSLPLKAKDDSLDPDFKMVDGSVWNANRNDIENNQQAGDRYTVRHTDVNASKDDYMNDMNWPVSVKGFQYKQAISDKSRGWIPLLI